MFVKSFNNAHTTDNNFVFFIKLQIKITTRSEKIKLTFQNIDKKIQRVKVTFKYELMEYSTHQHLPFHLA